MATRCSVAPGDPLTHDDDHRMTLLDAADFLNISERSMRRLQQSGQIRYFKVGGRVQFAVGDLRAHLATCERPAVNQ